MRDIGLTACEEIIHAKHFVASGNEPIAQMRTKKTSAAGNKDTLLRIILPRHRNRLPWEMRLR
jgi:hypothetical protein